MGLFLDAKSQSKFDGAKTGLCNRCGVADAHEHRCFDCERFSEVHRKHQTIIALKEAITKGFEDTSSSTSLHTLGKI